MKIIFRAARPEDAPELKRLNEAFNGPGSMTEEAMAACLSSPGGERVFAAQAGDRLAGFCCCQIKRSVCYEDCSAELTELYVEPEFRRQGVASGLLDCFQRFCATQGVSEIMLLTGSDNRAARAFYEQAGYSLTGELHYGKEL